MIQFNLTIINIELFNMNWQKMNNIGAQVILTLRPKTWTACGWVFLAMTKELEHHNLKIICKMKSIYLK